jgi:hypothetical protein
LDGTARATEGKRGHGMTDKEKLEALLPYSTDNFEGIVSQYLRLFIADFTPSRLRNLIQTFDTFLDTKIHSYEIAVNNSWEKASYLKNYLEGKMFKDEKSACANIGCQINNANSIIDFCRIATGERSENDNT